LPSLPGLRSPARLLPLRIAGRTGRPACARSRSLASVGPDAMTTRDDDTRCRHVMATRDDDRLTAPEARARCESAAVDVFGLSRGLRPARRASPAARAPGRSPEVAAGPGR